MGTFMNLRLSKVVFEKMKADHSTWEKIAWRDFSQIILCHTSSLVWWYLCAETTPKNCAPQANTESWSQQKIAN
jgi:hypothetical protein